MTNPAAFPHIAFNTAGGINIVEPGMTLRDWFAGQALAGMTSLDGSIAEFGSVAMDAYEFADAMMRVRQQTEQDCEQV